MKGQTPQINPYSEHYAHQHKRTSDPSAAIDDELDQMHRRGDAEDILAYSEQVLNQFKKSGADSQAFEFDPNKFTP